MIKRVNLKMKKLFYFVIFVTLISAFLPIIVSCPQEKVLSDPVIPKEALNFVRSMGFAVNVGNSFDSLNTGNIAGETGWGNPMVSREYIKSLRADGFKTVRLPVSWVDYMGPAPDYTIEESWMARIETVVNWILAEDMYCIINLHHDGGGSFNSEGYIHPKYWIKQISIPGREEEITDRFAKVWLQIATRFKDAPDRLILEAMNEIGFDGIWNRWGGANTPQSLAAKTEAYRLVNKLNQTFVESVRSTGSNNENRYLLVSGYWTDIDCTVDPAFRLPADTAENKLLLSVHFYDPYLFTMQQSVSWGILPRDKLQIENQLKKLKKPFLDRGIPVIVGEFAAVVRYQSVVKDPNSRQAWMLYVAQTCLDLNMCPALWDTGMRSGNYGMADVGRIFPFAISDNLTYVFNNIVYPE